MSQAELELSIAMIAAGGSSAAVPCWYCKRTQDGLVSDSRPCDCSRVRYRGMRFDTSTWSHIVWHGHNKIMRPSQDDCGAYRTNLYQGSNVASGVDALPAYTHSSTNTRAHTQHTDTYHGLLPENEVTGFFLRAHRTVL